MFFYALTLSTLFCVFRVHRAGSQLIIGIVLVSVCVIMYLCGSGIILQGDSWPFFVEIV